MAAIVGSNEGSPKWLTIARNQDVPSGIRGRAADTPAVEPAVA